MIITFTADYPGLEEAVQGFKYGIYNTDISLGLKILEHPNHSSLLLLL